MVVLKGNPLLPSLNTLSNELSLKPVNSVKKRRRGEAPRSIKVSKTILLG